MSVAKAPDVAFLSTRMRKHETTAVVFRIVIAVADGTPLAVRTSFRRHTP
jgi:hypothetical protein